MPEEINYKIGAWYGNKRSRVWFQLKEVTGFIFHFECGHWCTDCVFVDLYEKSSGKLVSELSQQLELKF